MKEIKLACPCLFGIESLVADEVKALGCNDVASTNGRVTFSGDLATVARANINLRCAERVEILVAEFTATSFEELFEGVRAAAWETFIARDEAFPVKGWSLNSQLHSIPDCQAIIKKAIVERLKSKYQVEWFSEKGAKVQIRFSILKDRVCVYLDTSGDGLHKRGYRENSNAAPLKETLAAALVKLARFYPDRAFYDPMCGSGTILIEAALLGLNIAPGINRGFACENWSIFKKDANDKAVFAKARQEARDKVKLQPITVIGSDIDEEAVTLTRENAGKAGVGDYVKVEKCDIRNFAPTESYGTIVTNPPYGERMLDIQQAQELYHEMGEVFLHLPGHFRYYIISADERFESFFGKKADKRRKLYNGMLKCSYFQYFKS